MADALCWPGASTMFKAQIGGRLARVNCNVWWGEKAKDDDYTLTADFLEPLSAEWHGLPDATPQQLATLKLVTWD